MSYVYDFHEGSKDQKDLLGGKGANLAEMTNLGLPVPPGFTISTRACRAYLEKGDVPDGLAEEIDAHLRTLEEAMGRRLGEAEDPLLVSVRSGAKFSMPGMMETVLNIGLNDHSVRGLAEQSQDERFAMDSYRRLLQMFGATVLGIDSEIFARALDRMKKDRGTESDTDLGTDDLRELVETFQQLIKEHSGREFPQDPREQLDLAVRAVFDSWNTERAVLYRRQERIEEGLGTAVNVQAMVFGNRGDDSGSGVAFTRDPASGNQGVYGDYLQNAQGEDVVAGIRNTVSLADMAEVDRASHDKLIGIMATLEKHYRDMCDIEFTVERGKLWMLQTRVGKRTPAAAFRIGRHMTDEGLIDRDEAMTRVTGAQLAQLMFPSFDTAAERDLIATGMNASPGAAVGKAVFDSDTAVEWAERGEDVILVRKETNPDDLRGMVAAKGILTSRGGKTSHAAVVARGMGRTCVCGAEALDVSAKKRRAGVRGGETISEGDVISIDGTTGEVFLGAVPVVNSSVMRYFEGEQVDEDIVACRRRGDEARRRRTTSPGARERRHPRGRSPRPAVRRRGHRPVPDRAHVPRRAAPARGEPHRRRGRGRPGGRARRAAPPPAQRLHRDLRGDGRTAGHDPADRPAVARVPARLHRARGQGRARGGPRGPRRARREAARGGQAPPRAEPDARPARGPPRHRDPRAVQDAGPGDPGGHRRPDRGRRRPAARDHDPLGRLGHRARPGPSADHRGVRARSSRSAD